MSTSRSGVERPSHEKEDENEVADKVDDTVDEHPWLERVTQVGWLAKGVVYTLMGLTALQIARQDPTEEGASPEGSLGRVADAPGGRFLLGVLTVGLVLYFVWRVLSVAVISGNDLNDWAHRIGYSFSAIFYAALAWTAGKATVSGVEPEESNSVERLSTTLLDSTVGRWFLGAVGIGTMAVGAYFVIRKGIQRSFADDLEGVSDDLAPTGNKRTLVLVSGMIGWIGRGFVTILVGFFITRAAVRFDPDDARGFDRSLRQVAGTSTGTMLVLACAVGLIAYGVFCFVSHRYRALDDNT